MEKNIAIIYLYNVYEFRILSCGSLVVSTDNITKLDRCLRALSMCYLLLNL